MRAIIVVCPELSRDTVRRMLKPALRSMLDPSAYTDPFRARPSAAGGIVAGFRGSDALGYPKRFNAAVELIDRRSGRGLWARGRDPHRRTATWTYAELLDRANRSPRCWCDDLGLVPGNRVLLRSANNPMQAAGWLGVMKAGGIAVRDHAAAARAGIVLHARQGQGAVRALRRAARRTSFDKAAAERPVCRLSISTPTRLTALEARMARHERRLSTMSSPRMTMLR